MEFSLDVALLELQKSCKTKSPANLMISPFGISVILHMIANGAAGPTLDELLHFLQVEKMEDLALEAPKLMEIAKSSSNLETDDGPVICNFNAVLVSHKRTLKESHREFLENMFHAKVKYVDFSGKAASVDKVNEWVNDETKGLIKPLLLRSAFSNKYLTLIHANGLYFKASWENEFRPSDTRTEKFHLLGENVDDSPVVEVPFMMKYESTYAHASFDDYSVLKMPYKSAHGDCKSGRRFSMAIILPKEKSGLPKLADKIRENPHLLSRKHMPNMEYQMISILQVPKFTLSYCFQPSDIMKELGLTLPFMDFEDNLTSLVEEMPLFVSRITQRSRVECDEAGTKVLSITDDSDDDCGFCLDDSPPPPPINFIVDHPFMFVIQEDVSDTIIFLGGIYNPQLV
ncbi:unnamed protein product [Cuscuta epithymum]|uniref:Serpin domain-containing protein n=1 Tax=Cuscuta epithymum TaxID=186058 RepID=A0AAV0E402_9ASTE|nr:unnamed protein product [Cuscuta epithymum]